MIHIRFGSAPPKEESQHGALGHVMSLVHSRRYTIGRIADIDIVLGHPFVSRIHAAIRYHGDTWLISDLGSINGTWVGDQRVELHQEVPFGPGSVIRIANVVCQAFASGVDDEQDVAQDLMESSIVGSVSLGGHAHTEQTMAASMHATAVMRPITAAP